MEEISPVYFLVQNFTGWPTIPIQPKARTGTHGFLVMYAETSFAEQQTPSVWRPEMLFFFFYGSLL